MLRTYRAVLRGDRIEWIDPAPERAAATPVHVTLLEDVSEADHSARGRAMADALAALASTGAWSKISDPVTWQRDLRSERALPGREG